MNQLLSKNSIWVVIPVYNNSATVVQVVEDCFEYIDKVLVVDDGSTDADLRDLLKGTKAEVVRHDRNMGKGKALLTALGVLDNKGADYMICLDGDGQHYASDIPKFIASIKNSDTHIYVGCRDFSTLNVPAKSKFGRKFSNMWFSIETGRKCADTQSGFRAYPIKYIRQLKLSADFYDFEAEVIARAVWAGIEIQDIFIDVHYPKPEDRVSSFRPIMDNLRFALMHARLVGRCLLPWPHKRFIPKQHLFDKVLLMQPRKFLKQLLAENASPMGLAAAAAVGTVLAVLPLVGCHTIAILYVCTRLHLNKVMGIAIQNLYMPPFVPFLCIELGYFIRHGYWLTDFSWVNFKNNIAMFIVDWWVGALILAPFYAIVAVIAVYYIAQRVQKDIDNEREDRTEDTTEKAW